MLVPEPRVLGSCTQPTLFIIDHDTTASSALSALLLEEGLSSQPFSNAEHFLNSYSIYQQGCVVSEINLMGMSGLELQHQLNQYKYALPVIFLSQRTDVPTVVRAMQQGALNFFTKPLNNQDFIPTVRTALALDKERRQWRLESMRTQARIDNLTRRERQVFELVIKKCSSKEIMEQLGIKLKTVEFHRARMMEKMHASSLIELIEITQKWL